MNSEPFDREWLGSRMLSSPEAIIREPNVAMFLGRLLGGRTFRLLHRYSESTVFPFGVTLLPWEWTVLDLAHYAQLWPLRKAG